MPSRKNIFILTFMLVAGMVLAGCGTQAAAEPAATEAPPTQPQVVPTEVVESASTNPPAEVPTEAPTEAPAATASFANDVMPIIQSRCVRCHGEDRVEEGLLMRTYEEIMAGSENGPVIVPGDPVNSKLVELITELEMPKRGPKLTPPQIQIITEWVAAGAPNN